MREGVFVNIFFIEIYVYEISSKPIIIYLLR